MFERNKPHVNVGTIGHVDHGKTTLTAAITKSKPYYRYLKSQFLRELSFPAFTGISAFIKSKFLHFCLFSVHSSSDNHRCRDLWLQLGLLCVCS